MEPQDKLQSEWQHIISPCPKCGHGRRARYYAGIKDPVEIKCPGCNQVWNFPDVEKKALTRQLAIGTKTAKRRRQKAKGKS